VNTTLEIRWPEGAPVPTSLARTLHVRRSVIATLWRKADPAAFRVWLEYHIDHWLSEPDQRRYCLVWVNGEAVPDPLPYSVLTDPQREGELRAFVRRARRTLGATRRLPHDSGLRRWLIQHKLTSAPRRQARRALEVRYRDTAHDALLIKRIAAAVSHQPLQAQLLDLEQRKRQQLERLEPLIHRFGGQPPALESAPFEGYTWAELIAALAEETHDVESYLGLRPLLTGDAAAQATLELLVEEERQNRRALREMMGLLDPYSLGSVESSLKSVAAMIDARVRDLERDAHLEREDRMRSGQPSRSPR
jgi:hypothetical protein